MDEGHDGPRCLVVRDGQVKVELLARIVAVCLRGRDAQIVGGKGAVDGVVDVADPAPVFLDILGPGRAQGQHGGALRVVQSGKRRWREGMSSRAPVYSGVFFLPGAGLPSLAASIAADGCTTKCARRCRSNDSSSRGQVCGWWSASAGICSMWV